ncbi:hypothetical protein [Methylobacterium sp. V23]|uniref:hypothetical protein n=1 Tax=Methylobacterium sp. V23 TaxID=2044878 RepID=UPI000CDA24FB|nr:hypothetical protein [Methylobacterium sp. V23]POR40184.1 hypothetical protein CRT23_25225 [Methylobacterium sp. V23]
MREPVRALAASVGSRKRPSRSTDNRLKVVLEQLDPSTIGQQELDVLETFLGAQIDEILRKLRG